MKKVIFTVLVMAVLTATADADLLSHWKLDETIGNTASDSADGNPGTVYGAQWVSGRVGGALSFDGVNDYVDVGDKDNLDFGAGSSFSIAAWVNSNIDTFIDTAILRKKLTHWKLVA